MNRYPLSDEFLPFVSCTLNLGFRYKSYHLIGLTQIGQLDAGRGCLPPFL